MADNVPITAGSGTTIATDEVGTDHYQKVKLVDGTADSSAVIPGDATNGLDVDVTRLPALVAGSAAIGKLAANDGVDIGDVSINAPLGAGTEAAAVRVTLATDSTGVVSVDDNGAALTVDNGGTFPVQATLAAGAATIAKAEDDASVTLDVGVPAMAVRKATPANTSDADGDYEMLQMSAGKLWVSATVDAALPAGSAAIGKLAANDAVDIGDVTINNASGASGVNIQDGGNSITVDAPTGTPINAQLGNATLVVGVIDETGAAAVDALAVGGGTAHDAVDSGNPLKVGGKARAAMPTAVTALDRVDASFDLYGRLLTAQMDPGMQVWKSINQTTTQTGSDVWSPTSGKRIAITYLAVSSYGTTAGRVILWFGANADTTYSAGTDQLIWAGSFAPSTTSKPGMILALPQPIFAVTADHEIHLTTDANLSIDITVYGYEF